MKIFVSSTYSDLIEERKIAYEVIRKMGYEPIWMEDFAANGKHPRDVCLEKVQECDAVLLLLGSSYGSSRDTRTGLSYTHLEYRTARAKRIPVLAFIKKSGQGRWESVETHEEARKNHTDFKNDVEQQVIRKSFSSLLELEKAIQEAIHNHAREYGWIGTPRSAFQTIEQFYQPFLNPNYLFHHTLPLIGRESHLKALIDFSGSNKQIVLLSGPDGIGKSRLLLETLRKIEKEYEELKVFMLGLTYTSANDHELPGGQLLIGVDDALTRDIKNLDELFRMVRTYQSRIKLVLAIRQEDLDEMKRALISAHFHPQEEILELSPLQEVEHPLELAKAILGKEDLDQISQLVTLASDSPLIMVIAGELLKRGKIRHTILAASHDDFRREVVHRYQQITSSSIIHLISPERVQKVSELLAALGPLDSKNERLVAKAAAFLQLDTDQLLETLNLLEKAGLALQRRECYSSVPDAMTYLILEQACFMESGRPYGFGSHVALEFTEPWQTQALKKLAEVDWLKGKGRDTGLLGRFWQQKQEQFSTGSTEERVAILQIVNDVAFLQPKVALDFVEMALHTSESVPTPPTNHRSVPEHIKPYLPNILEQIAQHRDYTKTAIHMLWDFGKNDFNDMSKSNQHPHHVLIELSKQRYGRAAAFYDVYLQCIETWCSEANAFERGFTPLNLIPSFLVRDGYEDYYFAQTQSIHMQPFHVLPGPMKGIRKRAIHLLASIGHMNEKPKLQFHAVEVLRNIIIRGLTYDNTPELRAQWYEEDRIILTELAAMAQKAKSAFVSYSIEYGLRLALKHPENAPIAENLRATLASLPLDLDTEIIWYLMYRKSAEQFSGEQTEEQKKSDDMTGGELAEHILQLYSTAQLLKKKLDDLFSHLALYDQQIVYPHFLESLTQSDPLLASELCMLVVKESSSPTVDYFAYFVKPVREQNATTFLDLIRDALKSGNPRLRQGAAYAICACTNCTDEESDSIITLIKDADPIIATRAIYAIHQLSEKAQDTAFSALKDVSITLQDERKVDAMCEALQERMHSPTWDPIPSMTSFLQKCVPVPEFSEQKHYRLCSFLLECRWKHPSLVAGFCLDRVKYWRSLPEDQRRWYEPTSCLSLHLAPKGSPEDEQDVKERYTVLCTIRDELLVFEESEAVTIFAYFANGYDVSALQVLSEWLESGEEQKIRLVAKLIRAAPATFVFDNEGFVERLLTSAVQTDENVSEQMNGALLSSAMRFGYVVSVLSFLPGQPAREHVQVRDRAEQVAGKYPLGSIMHTFYMDLMKEAEVRIEMQRSFGAVQ